MLLVLKKVLFKNILPSSLLDSYSDSGDEFFLFRQAFSPPAMKALYNLIQFQQNHSTSKYCSTNFANYFLLQVVDKQPTIYDL